MIEIYLMDEKRSGSMPMKRSRITEMIFLFDKLLNLNLVCDSFEADDKEVN